MPKSTQQVVMLRNVRCSFFDAFEATAMKQGDKPAYSSHFLIENEDEQLAAVKKTIKQVAMDAYGSNGEKILKQLKAADKICLRDGNSKLTSDGEVMDGYADHHYISARAYVRPTIIDRDKTPLSKEDGKPYSGCYVNAQVAIWAQTGEYGKRINCQLKGVQFIKDGPSFGGGTPADPDAFEDIADEFDDDAFGDSDDDLI
ncbi:ssDNA-binding protein [uncultured Halomonas sp.]|uniref:ssDNA-binding protein n=1 Tax=uncultured Halomonas sp. TaxID=173971 RepID=UPI0026067053|nr:ssDNA-binding protein [uncultured Halomonas sp.]